MSDDLYSVQTGNIIPEDKQRMNYENFVNTLHSLLDEVESRETLHLRKQTYNKWLVRGVSYPAMIFGGMAAFSGFTQFTTASNIPECGTDLWLKITTVIFLILALTSNITRDFFKFDTNLTKHEQAIDEYRSFYHAIDVYLKLNKGTEGDRLEIINSLRTQYESIIKKSPNIPFINHIEHEIHVDENNRRSSYTVDRDTQLRIETLCKYNLGRLESS